MALRRVHHLSYVAEHVWGPVSAPSLLDKSLMPIQADLIFIQKCQRKLTLPQWGLWIFRAGLPTGGIGAVLPGGEAHIAETHEHMTHSIKKT